MVAESSTTSIVNAFTAPVLQKMFLLIEQLILQNSPVFLHDAAKRLSLYGALLKLDEAAKTAARKALKQLWHGKNQRGRKAAQQKTPVRF